MKWIADTNLLFAAIYGSHAQHQRARAWLNTAKSEGWGIAVETFLSVVRLQMLPAAMHDNPSDVKAALRAVESELGGAHPGAVLVGEKPDGAYLGRAQGSKQINDFYLVQLAAAHGAKLATLDKGVHAEWPAHVDLVK
jgi:predicted nucleic acid-binding protein